MKQMRVLIVDDHTVVRRGIEMILRAEPSIQIVGEAVNSQDAIRQTKELQPDLILMDLVMPQGNGIEAIAEIKRNYPHIKILVLTMFKDKLRINAAIEAGADGYLLKETDGKALLKAIQEVQQGKIPLDPHVTRHLLEDEAAYALPNGSKCSLTERERRTLQLMAQGLNNREIGQALHLSEGTVKVYVSRILSKLNVSSRIEAAVWATQAGLISLDKKNEA